MTASEAENVGNIANFMFRFSDAMKYFPAVPLVENIAKSISFVKIEKDGISLLSEK